MPGPKSAPHGTEDQKQAEFDVQISTREYTGKALRAPNKCHPASAAELAVIARSNAAVNNLLNLREVITKEKGVYLHNGPCKILPDGSRQILYGEDSDFDDLSESRQAEIMAEFEALLPSEKAWEYRGPASGNYPVIVTHYKGSAGDPKSGMLQVFGSKGMNAHGWAVFVKNKPEISPAEQQYVEDFKQTAEGLRAAQKEIMAAQENADKWHTKLNELRQSLRISVNAVVDKLAPVINPNILETLKDLLRDVEEQELKETEEDVNKK